MVDIFSKFSPAIDPRFSYRGEDVVATLDRVCAHIGYPGTIRVDQGSQFVSRDLDLWAYTHGVTLDFSRPGKPTDNAFIEAFSSFVGKVRQGASLAAATGLRAFHLYRRARHRAVGAEHAAVALFWFQQRLAVFAFVEILARIQRHRLGVNAAAGRARDGGFDNNLCHKFQPSR